MSWIYFQNGDPTGAPDMGINGASVSGGILAIQTITYDFTLDRTLGSSSTSAITLRLNGPDISNPFTNLISVTNTGSFTIQQHRTGSTSSLKLDLAGDGNFNVTNAAAVLSIATAISESSAVRKITKTGAGTMLMTGTNSYTGGVEIDAGVLAINNDGALGRVPGSATTNVTLNGGTLRIASSTNAALDAKRNISLASDGTINVDVGSNTATINGAISGAGKLTKTGQSTLVLTSNANDFSGDTTISEGTLSLTGSAVLGGTSNITVGTSPGSAATFDVSALSSTLTLSSAQTLSGHGHVTGPLIVAGTISPGSSAGLLTTADETWAAGGTYAVDLNALPDPTQSGAGTNWDLLELQALSVTASSTSAATRFTIQVLAPAIPGWNPNQPETWKIATFTNNPTVDLSAFKIDTMAFDQSNNDKGGFLLQFGSGELDLLYVAPEPSTGFLMAAALFPLGRRHGKRHR